MPQILSIFRLPAHWGLRRARRTRMLLQLLVLTIVVIIGYSLYAVYKPPNYAISYLQQRYPQVLFHIATDRKVVALTIDDTPSQYTRDILELLVENDARATFFTIGGQVPGNEVKLVEILQAGSELGNHAMHDEPSISLSSDTLMAEIAQVDQLIGQAYETFGSERKSYLFRPGSGVFSDRVLDVVSQSGYQTILGSIYPHDPFVSNWRVNAWNILSGIRPGAVIICHDRRSWTVPMLTQVLPEIKRKGYEIVTVTELLQMRAGN